MDGGRVGQVSDRASNGAMCMRGAVFSDRDGVLSVRVRCIATDGCVCVLLYGEGAKKGFFSDCDDGRIVASYLAVNEACKRLAQAWLVMDRAAARRKQVFQARCDGIMGGGGQWAASSGQRAAGGRRRQASTRGAWQQKQQQPGRQAASEAGSVTT